MAKKYLDDTGMSYFWGKLKAYFQPTLVSGTNIKTINNETLLGSGDISVTSTPTASTISEFDSSAHMNSADMTSQEISDFVDSLNPSALAYEYAIYGDVIAYRSGNVVTLSISGTITGSATGWTTITTVGERFRPPGPRYTTCYNNNDTSYSNSRPVMAVVNQAGNVNVYLFSDKLTVAPRGSITYIVTS